MQVFNAAFGSLGTAAVPFLEDSFTVHLVIPPFFVVFCFVFPDRASLCVPGCPRTLLVDQTVFEGKDLPVSQIAGIKGV